MSINLYCMFIVGNPKTMLVIIHAPCIEDPYARAYQLWSPRRGAGVAVHARRDSQDTDRAPWTPDFRGSGMVFLALQVSGLVKLRILLRV